MSKLFSNKVFKSKIVGKNRMKKGVIIFGAVLSALLIAGLVAAQNLPAPNINLPEVNPSQAFNPIFQLLSGLFVNVAQSLNFLMGGAGLGEAAFGKFLLFILLVFILQGPSKFITGGQSEKMGWMVSMIVSLMGVFLLPAGVISAILLSYSSVAVAITVGFVMGIGFWFYEKQPRTLRKIGWWLTGFSFIAIGVYRATSTGASATLQLIYMVGFLVCVLCVIFDSSLSNFYAKLTWEKAEAATAHIEIGQLEAERRRIMEQITEAGKTAGPGADVTIKALQSRLDGINKSIRALIKEL